MSKLFTPRKLTEYIAVHASATQPKMDVGVKEIRQWHRAQGWTDIGYHYVIRRDGTLEVGRPEDVVGAHVSGFNNNSIGICLVGGVDSKLKAEDNFTSAQYAELAVLLRKLKAKYPKAIIQGHRDFPKVKKDCPCFDVRKWIAETGVFDTSNAKPLPNARSVEVSKENNTVYSIAKRYGYTVAEILKANPALNPAKLQYGQVIILPD